MKHTKLMTAAAVAAAGFAFASPASASVCLGNCGNAGADGDVTLSPTGNSSYSYVSTAGGVADAGEIAGVGDGDSGFNTGSQFTTAAFAAEAGDNLGFFFNYITSDGSSFADYGWAQLVDDAGANVAWLFTGRTQPDGDIAPGFGLPSLDAVLTPATSEIIDGETTWSPLGSDSGLCFNGVGQGCGQTGWIESTFTIADAGTYSVVFGVTNFNDSQFASGLAWDGLALNDDPVDGGGVSAVPEPATWAMMLLGFFALGGVLRSKPARVNTRVRYV